jgi:hypothetical protein
MIQQGSVVLLHVPSPKRFNAGGAGGIAEREGLKREVRKSIIEVVTRSFRLE